MENKSLINIYCNSSFSCASKFNQSATKNEKSKATNPFNNKITVYKPHNKTFIIKKN